MKGIVNNIRKSDTWKIQLTIAINLVFSNDTEEMHVMHSKSFNIELMIYDNVNEVIEELFESLLNRYQIKLKTSMKDSDFIFDCFYFLHYKCHRSPNCGGSYTDK